MGYTTEFDGAFSISPPLSEAHKKYLEAFSQTRRMKREDEYQTIMGLESPQLPDPIRDSVDLTWGPEGSYYVGGYGKNMGQENDETVIDHNRPPGTQPGLWCNWEPSEDGTALEWNGAEKFYHYAEWLEYLIKHFLKPWGYRVDGEVYYQGEDALDHGVIRVDNNEVSVEQTPHEHFCDGCGAELHVWQADDEHCFNCDYCERCHWPKARDEECGCTPCPDCGAYVQDDSDLAHHKRMNTCHPPQAEENDGVGID